MVEEREALRQVGHDAPPVVPSRKSHSGNQPKSAAKVAKAIGIDKSTVTRAELTALQRAEQIAEWVELTGEVLAQVAPKATGGRPEGGVRAAVRELGIERTEAQRAVKVASLSPEATTDHCLQPHAPAALAERPKP